MKILNFIALAGSVLMTTTSFVAHADEPNRRSHSTVDGNRDDWNNGGATYARFSEEYSHLSRMIQHGANDGSFNRSQAVGFLRELDYIRALARQQEQRGAYDPRVIQARLTNLHNTMHSRHTMGHDRQERVSASGGRGDDWNNGGATYALFSEEYSHLARMIRHGANDGSFNRSQSSGFLRELDYIRALARQQEQRGAYDSRVIQTRLTNLHNTMHSRHKMGHDRQRRVSGDTSEYRDRRSADGDRQGEQNRGHNKDDHGDEGRPR